MISRIAIVIFVLSIPVSASAHLATFGSWETTEKHLRVLFPTASNFRVKSHTFSEPQVAALESQLGFKLYPEDKTPAFYIAMKGNKFLGVGMFIDPRLGPADDFVRLEVGIGVDRQGKISRINLFEYRGDKALSNPTFLDQFQGMKLGQEFEISKNAHLRCADDLATESQLVANAAKEALLLMKVSLAKK